MERIDSDFIVLQELASRIEVNPNNAGWYMHRAYMLGKGCGVEEVLEHPPIDYSGPTLTLIIGGKRDNLAAPQQEVTQALAKGMERYGDAMQKLADSGD